MKVLGTMSFKKLLFDDLEEIVLPADILVDPANGNIEAPQDPRFQILKKMDAFVTRAADVSMNESVQCTRAGKIDVSSPTSTFFGRYV